MQAREVGAQTVASLRRGMSERLADLLDQAGLAVSSCIGWCAHPWYTDHAPTAEERQAGVVALAELLGLLPRLKVVVLLGTDACLSWYRLRTLHRDLADRCSVVPTRETDRSDLTGTDEEVSRRWAEQVHAFRCAATLVRSRPTRPWVTTEEEIVRTFTRWLEDDGWQVDVDVQHADVVATKGSRRLVAEAKGRTPDGAAGGLDLDSAYGLLLRQMDHRPETTRYALVVPESARAAAVRVPTVVRDLLSIDIYLVGVDGTVTRTATTPGEGATPAGR